MEIEMESKKMSMKTDWKLNKNEIGIRIRKEKFFNVKCRKTSRMSHR